MLVLVITTTDVPFGLELGATTLTVLPGAPVPYGTADPAIQVTVTGNGEDGIETNFFEVTILNETAPCPSSPGVAARACTYAATLPDGEYELSTRGFLGNASFGELDIGFVVDTNGPIGFIVSHPASCTGWPPSSASTVQPSAPHPAASSRMCLAVLAPSRHPAILTSAPVLISRAD